MAHRTRQLGSRTLAVEACHGVVAQSSARGSPTYVVMFYVVMAYVVMVYILVIAEIFNSLLS